MSSAPRGGGSPAADDFRARRGRPAGATGACGGGAAPARAKTSLGGDAGGLSARLPLHPARPALAAAHRGDTITIGPGTYAGGVTIDVSVKLVAGSGATIISGGGPVLTIGVADAPASRR